MQPAEHILAEIRGHAADTAPKECCGLIIINARGEQEYARCENISQNGHDTFVMHPEDYAAAEERGTIAAIVHSHPFESPAPSQADMVGISAGTVPWVIVNHPVGHYTVTDPSNYIAPLVGRVFTHGILDCYTLVRDYYKQECGIELPHVEREDDWWNTGKNLYLDNMEAAGFVRVDGSAPQVHDGFLMQIRSPVPNHAAVYLGDEIILHHMYNRLSSRDVYTGYWNKVTVVHLRHGSLINAA